MKIHLLAQLAALLACTTLPLGAQTNTTAVLFPDEDALTLENWKVVWPATPGLRYEVQQTTNLQSWSTAPGYPATANGPAQQMPFLTSGNARYFQVKELDEQPPAIASQYPQDGGFAVPRFANLTMQLSDATGINANSIQLTVGSLGTFTLGSTNLTYTNGLLTFINGGSIPLGGWSSNITATLIMADTLGYTVTNTWNFTLEVQPQVVSNLFVFGSPQAQRTGQQIGNIPTAALARRFGPIPMGAGDPWTLELVASNRLELSYTSTAPVFVTNTYVCNLTPARPEDIFNRKITALSDNPGIKRLTIFTVEVPLTEIATNASVAISSDSRALETGTNGAFIQMLYIGGTIPFPRIGYSLDGVEFKLKNTSGFDLVNLTLEEEHWWLTPSLQVSMEINWGSLKRFEAIAKGNIESASIWDVDFLLAGVAAEATIFDLPEAQEPKKWMLLGYAGPVPVFASLGFDVKLKGRAEVNATVNFRAGKRETADAAFGLSWNKDNLPKEQWVNTFNFPPPEVIPFTANINAEGSLKVSLEPKVEFLVYGLAGVSAGITPSAGVVFEIGTGQPLSGRLEADVSLDLELAGPAFDLLNPKPEFSLPLWSDQWHLFPDEAAITFSQQPQSQNVPVGNSANFFCTVAATGPPSYQWYFNGVPMAGQTFRTLQIPNVGSGHAGNYHVRVSAGSQNTNSASATLTVVPTSIQSGLVAWYPLNGNASDASGNGFHGVAQNVTASTDRYANANSAMLFNGVSSSIEVTNNFPMQNEMTAVVWVKPSGLNGLQPIVEKATPGWGGEVDFQMFYQGDGTVYWLVNTEDGSTGTFASPTGHTILPVGQWSFVTCVINQGNNQVRLYVNGVLDASGSMSGRNVRNRNFPFRIGKQIGNQATRSFNGIIDDVRIYNRALSASEIQQLYNSSLPPVSNPPAKVYYVAGSALTPPWNAGGPANVMTGSPLSLTTATVAGVYNEFKIAESNWAAAWPNNNAKVKGGPNGSNTFYFYPGFTVDGWAPLKNRVGYADPGSAWEIVGGFNGWSGGVGYQLNSLGNGVFSNTIVIPSAGSYSLKFRSPGSWDAAIGTEFSTGAQDISFTTTQANQSVKFRLDLPKGRYCVGELLPPPVTNYVVFAVDMSSQIQLGLFNPNTNAVFVSGGFNGWPATGPGALVLTNLPAYNGGGNPNIYYATNIFIDLPGAMASEYLFTDNNPNLLGSSGYEPHSTNRTFNMLSVNGVLLLPVASFGDGVSQ